jgi:hypothetical protein
VPSTCERVSEAKMRHLAICRWSGQIVDLNTSEHRRWWRHVAMIHLRWLPVRRCIRSFSNSFRVTPFCFFFQIVVDSGEEIVHKIYFVLSETLDRASRPCTKPTAVWTRSKSGTTFFALHFSHTSNFGHIAVLVTLLPVEFKRQKMLAYRSKGDRYGHYQRIEKPNQEA